VKTPTTAQHPSPDNFNTAAKVGEGVIFNLNPFAFIGSPLMLLPLRQHRATLRFSFTS